MEAVMDPAAPARGVVEQAAQASKAPAAVFRWSHYVHVGEGAEDCPHSIDGQCEDPAHFHAFCRLPNQFQHSDIRQRAQAAKARRIRMLRDPDSDANAVLEGDIAEIERVGDPATLVDELANRDFWQDQVTAMREVQEDERYEHVDQDRDRLDQLDAMDPMSRDNDERDHLVRHLADYSDAVDRKRKEIQQPRRSALEGLSLQELASQVREDRIAAESNAAFMEAYSMWEWFSCTLKPSPDGRPTKRIYATIEDLHSADRDVLDALSHAFTDLESSFQRGPTGNS